MFYLPHFYSFRSLGGHLWENGKVFKSVIKYCHKNLTICKVDVKGKVKSHRRYPVVRGIKNTLNYHVMVSI